MSKIIVSKIEIKIKRSNDTSTDTSNCIPDELASHILTLVVGWKDKVSSSYKNVEETLKAIKQFENQDNHE